MRRLTGYEIRNLRGEEIKELLIGVDRDLSIGV